MIGASKYKNGQRRQRIRWRPIAHSAAVAAMVVITATFLMRTRLAAAAVKSSSNETFTIKHLPDIGHARRLEQQALAAAGTTGKHTALRNLTALADSQNAVAEYWLGRYDIAAYKPGTRQYGWGIRWLQDSQAKGSRRAAALLYALYNQNHANLELAQKYLRQAAILGWPPAQYAWGIELLRADNGRTLAGIQLLTSAVQAHYLPAAKLLYRVAIDPQIAPSLRQAARRGLFMAARGGWSNAFRFAVGAFYNAPHPNYSMALRLARTGANLWKDAYSAQIAGTIYLHGFGVKQNLKRAFAYFNRTPRLRMAAAISGAMLLNGLGIPPNPALGIQRLQTAYRAGSGRAAMLLGEYYASKNNVAQAQNWFHGAIRIGAKPWNLIATLHLGVLLVQTAKTPADQAAGVKLIHSAAALGYAPAEITLGKVYAVGIGVARNRAKAIFWLRKAAAQGGAVAIQANKLLAALHAPPPKPGH